MPQKNHGPQVHSNSSRQRPWRHDMKKIFFPPGENPSEIVLAPLPLPADTECCIPLLSGRHSQASLRMLARRYGINQKTVAKWKKRESVADLPTGPKDAKSTVLSIEDEAIIGAFRRHTLLPLDDCFYALQPTMPHLTRSSLHRCLQRHGISRLPEVEGAKPQKKKFKVYPIGFFHIDIAEVQTAEGKLYLYVAIDRTSKFAFVQLVKKTGRTSASVFLEALIAAVPCKIHTVLTDNGIQFTFPPRYSDGPTARSMTHMFDIPCRQNGIEHRLPQACQRLARFINHAASAH